MYEFKLQIFIAREIRIINQKYRHGISKNPFC